MATYTLKDKIFDFFGVDDKIRDINKDGNGKGSFERYNEAIGEDYDEELGTLIDNLMSNTLVPQTLLIKFLPLMEKMLGGLPLIVGTENIRRKTIEFFTKLYLVKGTALSYQMLFLSLGFDTVNILEFTGDTSFDSDFTFDDSARRFDQSASGCALYTIELTGSITVDDEVIAVMLKIIEFLEPIYVELKEIKYNGIPVVLP